MAVAHRHRAVVDLVPMVFAARDVAQIGQATVTPVAVQMGDLQPIGVRAEEGLGNKTMHEQAFSFSVGAQGDARISIRQRPFQNPCRPLADRTVLALRAPDLTCRRDMVARIAAVRHRISWKHFNPRKQERATRLDRPSKVRFQRWLDLCARVLVEAALVGVFDLTKVGSQAWTVGAKVYWDDTNKRTTSVATSNTLIGVATEAVAGGAGDTIGRVRLNASF